MKNPNQDKLKGICQKVTDSCLGTRVRRAARVVGNHYDAHLKPSGLKGTQFTLLNAVYLHPAATISQLAGLMLLDRTTLNRNLKPLEKQGMIRSGKGEDQRTRTLELTAKGLSALEQALPLWLEAQSQVVDLLGSRIQRLADDLNAVETLGEA